MREIRHEVSMRRSRPALVCMATTTSYGKALHAAAAAAVVCLTV
jgi:hypothetical protein